MHENVHIILDLLSRPVGGKVVQVHAVLFARDPLPRADVAIGPSVGPLALSLVTEPLALILVPADEGQRARALPIVVDPLALVFVAVRPGVPPQPMLPILDIQSVVKVATVLAAGPDETTRTVLEAIQPAAFVGVPAWQYYDARPIEFALHVHEPFELLGVRQDGHREELELSLVTILRQRRHPERLSLVHESLQGPLMLSDLLLEVLSLLASSLALAHDLRELLDPVSEPVSQSSFPRDSFYHSIDFSL